ncbi:MAG TPA: GNAT family N-acetyltransferase [Bacteroidales bacterium]|nr:GNAT family N-acetyltransferase [Tenuifilaceae bacterium]HRW21171.1 GNAT family N-acetyltransferase [Bacteroidales bacterium]
MEFKSKTIYFRLVETSDAPFIHSLRMDKRYNQHLSTVDPDLTKQVEWIIRYKQKEALGSEYYFIIHRISDSMPIGTVRVYDFIGEKESFCWGSWILNENKTRYAALESAILIYDFAFLELGFKRCHMDIRKENLKVIEFHKRFGVKIIGETNLDLLGHYYVEDYLKVRKDILMVLNG